MCNKVGIKYRKIVEIHISIFVLVVCIYCICYMVYDNKYSKGPSIKLVFAYTGKNIDSCLSLYVFNQSSIP